MKKPPTSYLFVVLFILLVSTATLGQQNLSAYVDRRIKASVKARIEQTDNTKQSEPPAATGTSTSLVERSSAPDLFGLGLDFLNLSDSSTADKKSATPKTLTFSAYSLKSSLSGEDPLDPEIYNANKKWRAVSFTVGYDVPENTDERDPVVGIKWRVYDGRDPSSSANEAEILEVEKALGDAGVAFGPILREVRENLFESLRLRGSLPAGVATLDAFEGAVANPTQFQTILDSLTDDEKKAIDETISKRLSAFVNLTIITRNAVQKIRSKPQLALSFVTTQRRGNRPDEYSGALTFDKGMGQNSISINGSFFVKNEGTGEDAKGGELAAAFHLPLRGVNPLDYKDPLRLSLEATAAGATGEPPTYKAQAKLVIPLLPGMELPISVSVANRTELVNEKDVRGRFGFTFDFAKALKAFRDNFRAR